jgi:hypothetical protein
LEKSLYDRAEAFATAVLTQKIAAFALDDISEVARRDLANSPEQRGELKPEPELITAIIREVLASNGAEILEYLHNLSDAHTLMAFLRSTPDVQSAMSKVFSHGEISLDTTVLLPLIAEELLEGPRRFQKIIEASTHAGISFFATPGVLEELESHLKRGLAYDRIASSNWEGDIPFIYEAYARTGADPGSFRRWIEEFMGDARPIDDLSAYLSERFKIATLSLEAELAATDQELRVAVDEIWQLLHEERRERKTQNTYLDPIKINRLAKHDTENYLGIIQRRAKEATSPLGYSAWWLTFDRAALKIGDRLRSQYELPAPLSPVLSLDFLAQCLSFGSIRAKVSKEAIQSMPILIEPRTVSFLTPELLSEAATMRETMTGMSERVISRRVRDHLDEARRRMGPMAQRGVESYFDEL